MNPFIRWFFFKKLPPLKVERYVFSLEKPAYAIVLIAILRLMGCGG